MRPAQASLVAAVGLALQASPGAAYAQSAAAALFARAPMRAYARLAPDGAHLSYVVQEGGRQIVIVRSLATDAEVRGLALEPARERVRWCRWGDASHVLCGTISPTRSRERLVEQTRLYAVHTTGAVRELNAGSPDPFRDQVIYLGPGLPSRVLLQYGERGAGFPEVVEMEIATGARRRVVRAHPPIRRWLADQRGEVGLGVAHDGDLGSLHVRGESPEAWIPIVRQSLSAADALGPLALGAPHDLYALRELRGRAALYHVRLDGRAIAPELLFAHPQYDVAGPVTLDAASGRPLAVEYVADAVRTHALDVEEARRLAALETALDGRSYQVLDRTPDNRLLLVAAGSDVDPPSLHLFDERSGALRALGSDYPALEGRSWAPMRPIVYRARDGQPIPAYVTLPGTAASELLPAVVLPHGGPESRTWRTFDPLVQFLAAQGYAVLQMNFRGSFGFGAGFATAGAGQWGGVIHNDITDGARWLVERRVADPARLCIVGASFGGYAALLAATRESQWYVCAASFGGVTDLLAYARDTEALPDGEVWRRRLGQSSRALWQMSPMARVQLVETPVLIVHGRRDVVAPIRQVRRFARSLRTQGKPHAYVERDDCDHQMTAESCRRAFFDELERFLQQHLQAR